MYSSNTTYHFNIRVNSKYINIFYTFSFWSKGFCSSVASSSFSTSLSAHKLLKTFEIYLSAISESLCSVFFKYLSHTTYVPSHNSIDYLIKFWNVFSTFSTKNYLYSFPQIPFFETCCVRISLQSCNCLFLKFKSW